MFEPPKPQAEAWGYMLSPLRGEEDAASPLCAWQLHNFKNCASGYRAGGLQALRLSSATSLATRERMKPSSL
jgi:hypothetical protein